MLPKRFPIPPPPSVLTQCGPVRRERATARALGGRASRERPVELATRHVVRAGGQGGLPRLSPGRPPGVGGAVAAQPETCHPPGWSSRVGRGCLHDLLGLEDNSNLQHKGRR